MSASKKKPPAPKLPRSDFEIKATKAMRQAQRVAARENARFGFKLILEKSR